MSEVRDGATRLRIDLGYDGTDFHGWATQPGLRTVQETLEAAIATICGPDAAPQRLTVGGRTDAGVHARGQVAHIDIDDALLARVTARRVNAVLVREMRGAREERSVPDVVVHDIAPAAPGFDARFGALRRRYEYRVGHQGTVVDPLTLRYTAQVPAELDLARMQRASGTLLGLNDFAAFCKAREGATTVRELLAFEWDEDAAGTLIARVEADAFCHSMVRALIGSIVAVGSERITERELTALRDAQVRTNRFAVMPAHGLSLEEIVYPPDGELVERANQTRARRDAITSD